MKLALSVLCEHPRRKTGLTTLFQELVSHSLELFPSLNWLVSPVPNKSGSPIINAFRSFAGMPRMTGSERGCSRTISWFRERPEVLGAAALLTVGFVPLRSCLPVCMHLLSLQHVDRSNRIGILRRLYRGMVVDRSVKRAGLIITNSRVAAGQILAAFPDCRNG